MKAVVFFALLGLMFFGGFTQQWLVSSVALVGMVGMVLSEGEAKEM